MKAVLRNKETFEVVATIPYDDFYAMYGEEAYIREMKAQARSHNLRLELVLNDSAS